MSVAKSFACRVRELRVRHGLTQDDLSQKINVMRPNVSRMESGRHAPSADTVVLLCDTFEVSADYLLGLSDDPHGRARDLG